MYKSKYKFILLIFAYLADIADLSNFGVRNYNCSRIELFLP